MIENRGISFGIPIPAIEILSGILLLTLIYWAIKTKEWPWWFIVIGGGLNLCERIRFGHVNDYWKIPMIPLYNNLNDWLIFVGVILLIWKFYSKMK